MTHKAAATSAAVHSALHLDSSAAVAMNPDTGAIATFRKGVVTVLKAGGQWEILSSLDLGERIVATPVIHDGRLYVRSEKAIYCFAAGKTAK